MSTTAKERKANRAMVYFSTHIPTTLRLEPFKPHKINDPLGERHSKLTQDWVNLCPVDGVWHVSGLAASWGQAHAIASDVMRGLYGFGILATFESVGNVNTRPDPEVIPHVVFLKRGRA